MLLSNQWIGGNGLNLMGNRPSRRQLAGFDDLVNIDWDNPQNVGAAVNAEVTWLVDMLRAAKGLPPLPRSQTQPSVNVGLSAETKNMLIIGGLGLAALFLLSRKRG